MSIVSLRLDKGAVPTEDSVFVASGIKAYGRVGRFGRCRHVRRIAVYNFDGVKAYMYKGNLHMVLSMFCV